MAKRKGTHTEVGFIPEKVDRIDIADARADMANARCLELERQVESHAHRLNLHFKEILDLKYPLSKPKPPREIPAWLERLGRGLAPFGAAVGIMVAITGFVLVEAWLFQHGCYVTGSIIPAVAILAVAYATGGDS